MKPAQLLLSSFALLAAAALAGALGGMLATRGAPAAPQPVVAGPAPDAELERELARLADDVERLRDELAFLREPPAREPVVANAAPASAAAGPDLALPEKQAILRVIEEDRAAREARAVEERAAAELEQLLARAHRTAERFGLDGAQEKSLADVYAAERARLEQMRTELRGPDVDRERARVLYEQHRAWRDGEFVARFGEELGPQLAAADRQRRRRPADGDEGGGPPTAGNDG
jgi:hypothetical protein